ncbi:MAG: hypothetical protein R2850_01380 [Bacteroidia bacterium]
MGRAQQERIQDDLARNGVRSIRQLQRFRLLPSDSILLDQVIRFDTAFQFAAYQATGRIISTGVADSVDYALTGVID